MKIYNAHIVKHYSDRSFAVQGPRTWNSLPADLRAQNISVKTLTHKLKIFLFAVSRLLNGV